MKTFNSPAQSQFVFSHNYYCTKNLIWLTKPRNQPTNTPVYTYTYHTTQATSLATDSHQVHLLFHGNVLSSRPKQLCVEILFGGSSEVPAQWNCSSSRIPSNSRRKSWASGKTDLIWPSFYFALFLHLQTCLCYFHLTLILNHLDIFRIIAC